MVSQMLRKGHSILILPQQDALSDLHLSLSVIWARSLPSFHYCPCVLGSWNWDSFSLPSSSVSHAPVAALSRRRAAALWPSAARCGLVQAALALFPQRMQSKEKLNELFSMPVAHCSFEKGRCKAIHLQQRYFWSLFLLQRGDLERKGVCWHLSDESQGYSCPSLRCSGGGGLQH